MGWLWGTKKAAEPAPPRTDLVPIPLPQRIPEGAQVFFDPFDLAVRRRSLGRLPQYRGVVVAAKDVHEVAEEEQPQDGEEVPAAKWVDETDGNTPPTSTRTSQQPPTPTEQQKLSSPVSADEDDSIIDDDLLATIAKERAAVEEMRRVMEITEPEDEQKRFKETLDLLRFIRAREFKIPAAVEMYKTMLKWREDNKVDTILDEADPLEEMFQSYCGHRNHGYSYEGHPIYYERTGLVRVGDMLKHCVSDDDIVRRHIRFMEHALRRAQYSSMENGRNVEKIIMIHDLAHLKFTVETAGVKIFTKTVTVDQQMYPERLHKVFIINAPLSFRGVWAVVKPFIDPKTAKKIKILGADFQPSMLKQIPLSQLPEMYGGNCRCEYKNGDHWELQVRVQERRSLRAVGAFISSGG
ncbi:Hypothetical protein, putative [Bodo saltans]|uniref:CRAL-TRIO domain-containing protein n=1 Tax=Bodo saltans TaxID=75058 RepID=A0A0S4INM2_BODSA|nr:Hypothetical protein, putative [Bodo saltans]|eukprot:CUE61986.1 Hypothetical protein, putative [Bodo saltans]